jgi:hypothetical protein
MPRFRVRRPSAPLVISLIALFVALGGPAEAQRLLDGKDIRKGSVSSKQIKDRTIAPRDLSRRTVRQLRTLQDGAVSAVKLANGAVTPGKLATGAVGSPALMDRGVLGADIGPNAVTAEHIADGSLTASDVARFSGRFRITIGDSGGIPFERCWSGDPVGLSPEVAGADISQDLVVVTPGPAWPPQLSFTTRNSGTSRFTLTACNTTPGTVAQTEVNFRYAVIDIP